MRSGWRPRITRESNHAARESNHAERREGPPRGRPFIVFGEKWAARATAVPDDSEFAAHRPISNRLISRASNRQDMNRARRAKPDNVGLTDLGVGHQAILGAIVLGQMPHDFADVGDAGCSQRMALAEQAAR